MEILYEDLEKIFRPFEKFYENFLKLKILIEDLPNISKRFLLKIFRRSQNDFKLQILERSQKDFPKKLYEDLLKKINVDLLKIF